MTLDWDWRAVEGVGGEVEGGKGADVVVVALKIDVDTVASAGIADCDLEAASSSEVVRGDHE